jgi:hypothetical protein
MYQWSFIRRFTEFALLGAILAPFQECHDLQSVFVHFLALSELEKLGLAVGILIVLGGVAESLKTAFNGLVFAARMAEKFSAAIVRNLCATRRWLSANRRKPGPPSGSS